MGFITEKIPEDQRWKIKDEFFDTRNITGQEKSIAMRSLYWAINREKDVFLLYMGSLGGECRRNRFGLIWKGQFTKFEADAIITRGDDEKHLVWKMGRIWPVAELREKRDELIKLAGEALIAYGYNFNPETYASIRFEK